MGAYKGTHELAGDLRRNCVHINTLPGKKLPRILDIVNPGRLDSDLFETSARQLAGVVRVVKRARDTADPQFDILSDLGGNFVRDDDI